MLSLQAQFTYPLAIGDAPYYPAARIAETRGVNDRTATNVAQIVISGTVRLTPQGVISMPAFGSSHSDSEIAAVANYVTARFGGGGANLTA